ncbi:MAG: DUF362 domain-containing protein [Candidatus Thorarchaeota archaeon]
MMLGTPYSENGKSLVGKVIVSGDLKESIDRAVELIGGFKKVIKEGDLVTIKPNLNTADPYPASTAPDFLKALGELLLENGAGKLRVIDSSTLRVSARETAEKIGFFDVLDSLDAEFVFLEEHKWIKVKFPKGKYMRSGSLGSPVVNPGTLVLAPCLKTHRLARFTGAMKLFVGWLKKTDRIMMHARKLEQKVVDLASYFSPSLIVMDARECFVTQGPMYGQVECSEVILASGDMVAIDVEGVKMLQSYDAENRLNMDVWEIPQIKHAVDLGIGSKSDEEIEVIIGS